MPTPRPGSRRVIPRRFRFTRTSFWAMRSTHLPCSAVTQQSITCYNGSLGLRKPFLKNVLLSWSSGKDSAWALRLLSQQTEVRIAGLLTTFNRAADRVAMHAVRRSLVEMQAARTGLPLWPVELPWPCSNVEYEEILRGVCDRARSEGIHAFAFGDLFLRDIRDYRERQLAGTGLEPLFPLWELPTQQLA